MTGRYLEVLSVGPAASIQDRGRPGYQRYGVSTGGALDPIAVDEGAALLGQDVGLAVIELCMFGGSFKANGGPLRIALTGAPMTSVQITTSGERSPVTWCSSLSLAPGEILEIGAVKNGFAGYISIGGGIVTPPELGSRAAHLRAGLGGGALTAGAHLPVGDDAGDTTGMLLPVSDRFAKKEIRALWGSHAYLYPEAERERFAATDFKLSAKRDRMGTRLDFEGPPFQTEGALSGLSDAVSIGDVQLTGDGLPIALLADCQPTGGYPRIATVTTADLPALAQLSTGSGFRFIMVDEETAVEALRREMSTREAFRGAIRPLLRDPREITDLLSYNLIDGVVSGAEEPQ
ncbi:biotin-dependent carboxyltransferase family protein [Pelagibius sp. Alg239-R121]|uniref:5-oxoprolinase subunit C family protein n=1 Tax=Pelagibius sp. Alg239-R121 TaxID=2993448 RepID=UPI0024A6AE5D|nr:biotin-dependent carboxyltransferase family protein [Pelagibius sp. Alg239-R121]